MYDIHCSKVSIFTNELTKAMKDEYTNVYDYLFEVYGETSISPAFISNIQTLFIKECPHSVGKQIFELVLMDG